MFITAKCWKESFPSSYIYKWTVTRMDEPTDGLFYGCSPDRMALRHRNKNSCSGEFYCTSAGSDDGGRRGLVVITEASQCYQTKNRKRKKRNISDSPPEMMYTFIEQAVQPGTYISLKCSAAGNPPPRFTWTLDTQPVIQSHRISYGEINEGAGYRVTQLNITSVRVDDGGLYTCEATNNRGQVKHSARLNVYGPPYIRSIGTIRAITGTDITIVCPYYGFPISSVKWESGNGRELSSPRITSADGALHITNVDATSDSGSYICEVKSPGGELARRELRVHVSSPPTLSPMTTTPDLKAGHRTQLTCTVTSGDMPVHFTWMKDNAPISNVLQVEERTADFFSLLVFKSLSANHGGLYTCVVTNAAGSANVSAELLIKVPPWWKTEPTDASVLLGGNFNIPCEAKGHPTPSVYWTKVEASGSEIPINTADSSGVIVSGGSLKASGTRSHHTGQYRCRASNGVAPDIYKIITVTVHEPARFETSSQNVSAVRGVGVKLTCTARGETPLTLQWTRAGRSLPHHDYRMSVSETSGGGSVRSQLSIERAERRDSGLYRCQASNAYGRSEHFIHLAVQEPPDPPSDFRVTDATSRTIHLAWRRPFDGHSPVIAYSLQYRRLGPVDSSSTAQLNDASWESADVQNVTVPAKDLFNVSEGVIEQGLISGLQPGSVYAIRAWARSQLFTSPPGRALLAATSHEPPAAPPNTVRVQSHTPGQLSVDWQVPAKSTWNGELLGYVVSWWIESSADSNKLSPRQYSAHGQQYQEKPLNNLYSVTNGQYFSSYGIEGEGVARAIVRGVSNTKYVIMGLNHYSRYIITVKAFNRAGAGPPSTPTKALTQESVPSVPPSDLRCRALSSQSLKVEWSPPPSHRINGALKGYKLVYRPMPNPTIISWSLNGEQRDSIRGIGGVEIKRVLGLESQLLALRRAHNYSIQVLAYTDAGDGAVSSQIYCSTEDDVPDPPADVKVIPVSGKSLLISWLPPERLNGHITHYTIYYREVGSSNSASSQRVSVNDQQEHQSSQHLNIAVGRGGSYRLRPVSGTGERHFEVWVTASASSGDSAHSRHITQATTLRASARIASFGVRASVRCGQEIILSCDGADIDEMEDGSSHTRWTRKRLSTRPTAIVDDARFTVQHAPKQQLVIHEMDLNLSGNYTCSLTNSYGSDEITYQVSCWRPPKSPNLELQYSNRDSARVIWKTEEEPTNILGYTLYYMLSSDGALSNEIAIPSEVLGYTLRGLQCYVVYKISIVMHTTYGDSDYSKPLTFSTTDNEDPEVLSRAAIWSNSSSIIIDTRRILKENPYSCEVRIVRIQYRRADQSDLWRDADVNDKSEVCACDVSSGAWYALRVWLSPRVPPPPPPITLVAATTTRAGEIVPRPMQFLLDSGYTPVRGEGGAIGIVTRGVSSGALAWLSGALAAVAALSTAAVILLLLKRRRSLLACDADTSESRECVSSGGTSGALTNIGGDNKSCSNESTARVCSHDYSATPGHKLSPDEDVYEISPYATFQVGGVPGGPGGRLSAAVGNVSAGTLAHELQFRTFGHRDNDAPAPRCRRHTRDRDGLEEKHRVDCELQHLSRYEKFHPRHRVGGSYCVPLAHTAQATLSELYAGDSSADSSSPPRIIHSTQA